MSKNTALTTLDCDNNALSAERLNSLFGTLSGNADSKEIDISLNPGDGDCDRSIAIGKGWTVK